MTGSIDQLFSKWLTRAPERNWLLYQSHFYSYSQIDERINQLIVQLADSELHPGDRVAIYMGKSPGMVAALLACSRLGLVAVPVHPVLKSPQLNHILNDSSAAILIIDEKRRGYVESSLDSGFLRQLVSYEGKYSTACFEVSSLYSTLEVQKVPPRFSQAELLLYTSGSTGKPKGVVISKRNIQLGAESVSAYLGLKPEDRILSLLPFAFDYGFNQLTSSLQSGAELLLMDYLFAADVVREVQTHNVTVIAGVPPLWLKLLKARWGENSSGGSVRLLTNSGGRLPKSVQESLLEIFPRAELVLMYGLTEAFRSTYLPPKLRADNPGAIGLPIPHTQLFVINGDGAEAGVGEPGELVHCGPLVTLGYWGGLEHSDLRFRDPPLPTDVESESGKAVWSGDQVYRDEKGLFYFIGREDGLIKSSGYRISPEEVEEAAYSLTAIQEAVAFGVEDDELGQRLILVVFASDPQLSESQVCQHLRQLLPEYMVPQQVVFRGELPRTPSGKFDRVLIKAQSL